MLTSCDMCPFSPFRLFLEVNVISLHGRPFSTPQLYGTCKVNAIHIAAFSVQYHTTIDVLLIDGTLHAAKMAPNLARSQHELIYDMIASKSLSTVQMAEVARCNPPLHQGHPVEYSLLWQYTSSS